MSDWCELKEVDDRPDSVISLSPCYLLLRTLIFHERYQKCALYRNSPKFLEANSVDPDQTARSSLVRSTLFAIPSESFGCMILW